MEEFKISQELISRINKVFTRCGDRALEVVSKTKHPTSQPDVRVVS